MSLTITNVARHSQGDQFKVTFTGSITTGSETITANDIDLNYIEDGQATDSLGYTYRLVPATGGLTATLTVYYVTSATTSPLTAVGSGVLVGAVAPKFVIYGR